MYDVAVMHDFFVDRIVYVNELDLISKKMKLKEKEGGGSIHNVRQEERAGGNAVNLAKWTSFLGIETVLLTHSDETHLPLLKKALPSVRKLLIKNIEPGLTVSFESKTNIMVSYTGGAEFFGPEIIEEEEWKEICNSRVLCIMNWSANKRGTELVAESRKKFKGIIYVDPADFRDRLKDYRDFINIASTEKLVNWYSFNQYEAEITSSILGIRGEIKEKCLGLAKKLSSRVDIHTSGFSIASNGKDVAYNLHSTLKENIRTGAGDIWNASSIYCYLQGYDEKRRLEFSDKVASLYITSKFEEEARRKIRLFLKHS
jgi:sugar/nucleoside kinase (ribokinase family)